MYCLFYSSSEPKKNTVSNQYLNIAGNVNKGTEQGQIKSTIQSNVDSHAVLYSPCES